MHLKIPAEWINENLDGLNKNQKFGANNRINLLFS